MNTICVSCEIKTATVRYSRCGCLSTNKCESCFSAVECASCGSDMVKKLVPPRGSRSRCDICREVSDDPFPGTDPDNYCGSAHSFNCFSCGKRLIRYACDPSSDPTIGRIYDIPDAEPDDDTYIPNP